MRKREQRPALTSSFLSTFLDNFQECGNQKLAISQTPAPTVHISGHEIFPKLRTCSCAKTWKINLLWSINRDLRLTCCNNLEKNRSVRMGPTCHKTPQKRVNSLTCRTEYFLPHGYQQQRVSRPAYDAPYQSMDDYLT